ncbi:MAG: type II CRISPR-associated endonuclease Cas1 [Candidatus Sumerlaeia bacterium]|nr:type II CRISPR-associated endonuclease Cas1 [Candidatus Sumerlaeia bacterium]
MERILDFSDQPVHLSVRLEQLVIKFLDEEKTCTTPLKEIAVIIVSNPRITYTQSVLVGLAENNGILIVCDNNHLPLAMLTAITSHSLVAERIALQANASKPTLKRLWQTIVKAKISAQAELLSQVINNDGGLRQLASLVRSGDPDNYESQSARIYWQLLFNDPDFRRRREGLPPNNLLNYGYAILRAIFSRAICSAGFHPSLGIHHHNRYNAFCLADDLMEPFRPLVDKAVLEIFKRWGAEVQLIKPVKRELIEALLTPINWGGEQRSLFDVASRICSELVAVFSGNASSLTFYKIL